MKAALEPAEETTLDGVKMTYPKLVRCIQSNGLVLATAESAAHPDMFAGVLVYQNGAAKGAYKDDWVKTKFALYLGAVRLSN